MNALSWKRLNSNFSGQPSVVKNYYSKYVSTIPSLIIRLIFIRTCSNNLNSTLIFYFIFKFVSFFTISFLFAIVPLNYTIKVNCDVLLWWDSLLNTVCNPSIKIFGYYKGTGWPKIRKEFNSWLKKVSLWLLKLDRKKGDSVNWGKMQS